MVEGSVVHGITTLLYSIFRLVYNLCSIFSDCTVIPTVLRASQVSSFGSLIVELPRYLSLSRTRAFPPKHLCDVGPMPIAQLEQGYFQQITA